MVPHVNHRKPISRLQISVLAIVCCIHSPSATADESSAIENSYWVCRYDFETATSKRLFALPQLNSAGSICFSPDQQRMAFNGAIPGKHSTSNMHIFVCNPDGSDLQDLGPGTLPSWSPRGKRIVFSRFSPEHGVWIMNGDGSNARLIDNQGWGAQWSPNGNMIVYRRRLKTNDDFVIFNLVEDEFTTVFGKSDSGYSSLNWNFAWSPDSSRICFKGSTRQSAELGIVDIHSRQPKQILMQNTTVNADFSWRDKSTIVTSQRSSSLKRTQLYRFDVANPDAGIVSIEGQFTERSNFDAEVSQDGRTMLFFSRKPIN